MLKESYLYKKLNSGKTAQCQTCSHYCILEDGQTGKCGVRQNQFGKIYSLVYGKHCGININPIEKKPFFHFLPGSKTLSIATAGCNLACKNCQNWSASQGPKIIKHIQGQYLFPKRVVELARENKVKSISYTYTEPTIFLEYALDTMKTAKEMGLKNVWKTNGFMSKETIEAVAPYLDAVNVDLKGFSNKFYNENCGASLWPVLNNMKKLKKKNIWTEVTTLIIPGLNDSETSLKSMAKFIKNELGSETPWHIARFLNDISWKTWHLPATPQATIERAYEIGKKAGLKYVYTGNIPGLNSEDTFCPRCSKKAIERVGLSVERLDSKGFCRRCGENLHIIE